MSSGYTFFDSRKLLGRTDMRCLIAILTLFLGLTFAAQADQPDAISEFYAGHAALQQSNPQEAIEHFSKALEMGKLDQVQVAYVHHYRAIAYQRLDRQQEAIDDYTQALAIGSLPKRVQAAIYYNRAIALDHLANFERAIKDYTQAIALKPDYAEAYMNRGNAYRKLGDNDAALKDYKSSASYGNPIKQLPYYGEGLVLESRGDKSGAFKAFQTALMLAPDFEPARLKVEGYKAAGMKPTIGDGVTASIESDTAPAAKKPALAPPKAAASSAGPSAPVASTSGAGAININTSQQVSLAEKSPGLSSPSIRMAESSTPSPSSSVVGTSPRATTPGLTTLDTDLLNKRKGPGPSAAAPGLLMPPPQSNTSPATVAQPAGPSRGAVAGDLPSARDMAGKSSAAIPGGSSQTDEVAAVPSAESSSVASPAPPPARVASNGEAGAFQVQVGAYESEDVAQRQANQILGRHGDLLNDLNQNIERADLGARGIYYRLRFGPFSSRKDAINRCAALKSAGQDCVIVKRTSG